MGSWALSCYGPQGSYVSLGPGPLWFPGPWATMGPQTLGPYAAALLPCALPGAVDDEENTNTSSCRSTYLGNTVAGHWRDAVIWPQLCNPGLVRISER